MGFGTDGEFALKPIEISRCSDDLAADVLGWNCILSRKTHFGGSVPCELQKKGEQDA